MTKFQAKCIIGLIWSFALLTPLPTALLSRLVPKQQVIYVHSSDTSASAHPLSNNTSNDSGSSMVSRSELHSERRTDFDRDQPTTSGLSVAPSRPPLELYSCVEQWENPDHRYLYSMLLMALQYMLPIVVLVYTYSRIAFVVWIKKTPGEAQDGRDRRMAGSKRRMVKMMIIVVSVYTLCWLPLNTLIVIADLNEGIWQIK
jgi:hypothetical protein